jgi:hypothetical protein
MIATRCFRDRANVSLACFQLCPSVSVEGGDSFVFRANIKVSAILDRFSLSLSYPRQSCIPADEYEQDLSRTEAQRYPLGGDRFEGINSSREGT